MFLTVIFALAVHCNITEANFRAIKLERMIAKYFSLLGVWFALHTGGPSIIVTGEPTASAWIVTPIAERKEGGWVEMRCVASNLQEDHVVEWATARDRFGADAVAGTDPRFMVETNQTENGNITQDFIISNLRRNDTGDYLCNVYNQSVSSTSIVATIVVSLSVLYFPDESFPICSPDGPITVNIGTQLNMTCSSEHGNPTVRMSISQTPPSSSTVTWTALNNGDRISRSLNLTVDASHEGALFHCFISSKSFPNMTDSCSIGPINVTNVDKSEQTTVTEPNSEYTTLEPLHSSAIASAVAAGGVLVVVVVAITICLCNRRQRCLTKGPTQPVTHVSTFDTYTETHKSTVGDNRECFELAAKEATTCNSAPDGETNVDNMEAATEEVATKDTATPHQKDGNNTETD